MACTKLKSHFMPRAQNRKNRNIELKTPILFRRFHRKVARRCAPTRASTVDENGLLWKSTKVGKLTDSENVASGMAQAIPWPGGTVKVALARSRPCGLQRARGPPTCQTRPLGPRGALSLLGCRRAAARRSSACPDVADIAAGAICRPL